MNIVRLHIVLFIFFGVLFQGKAQIMPANGTVILNPPSSIFLADYYTIGSNSLQTIINFTDFSESSWDVRLRVTIESADIKITTNTNVIPANPINVKPGVPLTIQGDDFYDYLSVNNVTLQGITQASLLQTGKLPEGLYEFCVEILDYQTGIPLSLPACNIAYLFSEPPPVLLNPYCEDVVVPQNPQNIYFQWQIAGGASPTIAMNSLYKLMVYEVMDENVDPYFAVQNNNALLVYESDYANQTSFTLDFTTTLLTAGKKYVYRVRAVDDEEQDIYANNGYSEWCWFYYGYPENGELAVVSPMDEYVFSKNEQLVFQWSATELSVPGQSFNYNVKIKEIDENQTAEDAMATNNLWHDESLPASTSLNGGNFILNQPIEPGKKYAWQVLAFSDNQEVAASDVYTYYAPPLVEEFFAGSSLIKIVSLENENLDSLKGVGRVQMSPDPQDYIEVPFAGIKLEEQLGSFLMLEGELTFEIEAGNPIELDPSYSANGAAFFNPMEGKVSPNGFQLFGNVNWPLPHPVVDAEAGSVVTNNSWFTYNSNYEIVGVANLTATNQFELIDPLNFEIDLLPSSDIQVSGNIYTLRLVGSILTNANVKTNNGEQYKFGFPQQNQLQYFEVSNLLSSSVNYLKPIDNANFAILPKVALVDLSETVSPDKMSGDPFWKGIYFPEFKTRFFQSSFDGTNQVVLPSNFDKEEDQDDDFKFWIDAFGLQLIYAWEFPFEDEITFNQFRTKFDGALTVENSNIVTSEINGTIKIPFVDLDDEFDFKIPIENDGFQLGYLLEDITTRNVVFNPFGNENRVDIEIDRAVFAENNRLELDLTVSIPALDVEIPGVTDFRAYGNGYIGVGGINSALPLDYQSSGIYKNYPAHVEELGASLKDGNYAFSYVASMDMGADVMGENGPPKLIVSSVADAGEDIMEGALSLPPPSELPVPLDALGTLTLTANEMFISIDNPLVAIEGNLSLTQNDPYWGTCFRGGINGSLKIPAAIDMGANMILGRNNSNTDYWYFDTYFNDQEGMGVPVFNVFNMTAMESRLYHHMKKDTVNSVYLVDSTLDLGADIYMQIIDQGGGTIFQADIAGEVKVTGSDFDVNMKGDLAMINMTRRESLGGQIVAEVTEELVEEIINAIGPISLTFDIADGSLTLTAEGTRSGSLSFSKGDMDFGFQADLNGAPGIGFDFSKGSDAFHFNANAAGTFGLSLGVDNKLIDVGISGTTEGHLNFEFDNVSLSSSINRVDRTGGLSFSFDDKLIALGIESDGGFMDVELSENTSFSTGFNASGSAHIDLSFDGRSFAVYGDKSAGLAGFDINSDGVELSTNVNTEDNVANFNFNTSGSLVDFNSEFGVGASFLFEQGDQHFEVSTDLSSLDAKLDIVPNQNERYFAEIENGEIYSFELTKGVDSYTGRYALDSANLFFEANDISLGANKIGTGVNLSLGYVSQSLSVFKDGAIERIGYTGNSAIALSKTDITIDNLLDVVVKLSPQGVYMNDTLLSQLINGIDTTFDFNNGLLNLNVLGTNYKVTLTEGDNSVVFETNDFTELAASFEYDGKFASASLDGLDAQINIDNLFTAGYVDDALFVQQAEDKKLSLTTTGIEVEYEEYVLGMEMVDGEPGILVGKGEEQFHANVKGFELDIQGRHYAVNEEEYLTVLLEEDRLITITDKLVNYFDTETELIILGEDNYLEAINNGKSLALTKEEVIVFTDGNYQASLTKDLYAELTDGVRTIGLNEESHLVTYEQGGITVGIRGEDGSASGIDVNYGDNTIFVEGERNESVTIGIDNVDYGEASFTVYKDTKFSTQFTYDERELKITKSDLGFQFTDSENDAEPEFLEDAAQAPAMDGPQYIGDGITTTSGGRLLGTATMYFNTVNGQFIGNGAGASNIIPCASGAIAIEASPDTWKIDLGSKNQPVTVTPICMGLSGGGWLSLSPDELGMGLVAGWHGGGSVKIGNDAAGARLSANLDADLTLNGTMDVDPFKLNSVEVAVSLSGSISAGYWCTGTSGSINLVSVGLNGSLLFEFEDTKTIAHGSLNGYVSVLDIVSASFGMGFRTEF